MGGHPLDPRDLDHDVFLYRGRQQIDDTSVWAQLTLAEPFMEAHRVPGLGLWFQPAEPTALGAQAAATLALMARGWAPREDVATEVRLALSDPGAVAGDVWRRVRRRSRPGGPQDGHALRVQLEQAPDPENRVVLSRERDDLGQPRADLRFRLDPAERRRHVRSLRHAADALGLDGRRLARQMDVLMAAGRARFFWHHMGTTRMHEDPARGVVDAECRVHGVANLFVAGSSVFPTGGPRRRR